jgi:hypothetical protein
VTFDPVFDFTGLLVLTQLGQFDGEVISRVQGRSASTDRNPAGTWVKVAVEAGWAALIL